MANIFAGDPNCKGWWQFEPNAMLIDTMGLNDFDEEGGSPVVDAVQHREGLGALYLDGSSYLELYDASLTPGFPLKNGDTTKYISVTGWVRFASINEVAIFKKGYQDHTFYVGLKADAGDPEWCIGVGTGAYPTIERHYSGVTPVVNHWYHFGVTYRDDTKAYVLRVWDGASVVVNMSGNGTADVQVTNQAVWVGYPNIGDVPPTMWIDELVVFGDLLSTAEIDDIRNGDYVMELPQEGDPIPATPLVPEEPEVIVVAPWYGVASFPIKERLRFNTEIIQSHDRTEQRIAKRMGIPRQEVTLRYLLRTPFHVAEFENILHTYAKGAWPVPLWFEATEHPDPIAAGAMSVTISTAYASYRVGSYAHLFHRAVNWEITAEMVQVVTVAAGSIALYAPVANTYPDGAWVMPARIGYIEDVAEVEHLVGGGALVDVTFAAQDNETVLLQTGAFDGWSGDLISSDNPDTITMDGNKAVTATFTP